MMLNTIFAVAFCLIFASRVAAGPPCAAVTNSDQRQLLEYVHKRFKVPATVPLEVTEISFVGDTCYRKLRFKSSNPQKPFQLDLVASGDARFLTRELLDVTVDPVEEERKKKQALISTLTRGNFPSIGSKDAPVTIVMFSDFQCPYCRQMAEALFRDIIPASANTVRLIFRNFPLPMHAWAREAAEAAACAQEQSDAYFWSFHNYLFEHQNDLGLETLHEKLFEHAAMLQKFDLKQFGTCWQEKRRTTQIDEDIAFATDAGLSATPTTFVNGEIVVGFSPDMVRALTRQFARH